jgi:hypothetical protein
MTDAVGSSTLDFPENVEDYILIIKDDCKKTNELLKKAHPDIEFVCRKDEGANKTVIEEQYERTENRGLLFPEETFKDDKKQLYYCERRVSSFPDNANLKLYEYSENKFKEIDFRNNGGFIIKLPNGKFTNTTPNGVFIKRSDRKGNPDNFPDKDDSLKLTQDDRKEYFDNMIEEYKKSKDRFYGGGKRSSRRTSKKRPNRKRKSTKRRRGTRKRSNKKR